MTVDRNEPWQAFLRDQHARRDATISQVLDDYLADLERRRGPRPTLRSKLKHAAEAFGPYQAADVGPAWISAWVDYLRGRLSEKTVSTILAAFSAALSLGVETGALAHNPVKTMRYRPSGRSRKDPGRSRREVLSVPQATKMVCDPSIPFFHRLLYGILLLTGARFSEAAGLEVRDVSPADPFHQLLIERQVSAYGGQLIERTKTNRSRQCPVGPPLASLLAEAPQEFRRAFGRDQTPRDPLAPYPAINPEGVHPAPLVPGRWTEKTALRAWHADLIAVGIPHPSSAPRRLHSTRHTFVSLLRRAGADKDAVRAIVNDSAGSAGDVLDTYQHLDWPSLCAAVALLKLGPSVEPKGA
jgi:integrase